MWDSTSSATETTSLLSGKIRQLIFGIYKMYLMLEKQHNRGQDGAGFASIKFDMNPGDSFMSRVRSSENQPIQDIFSKINSSINTVFQELGNTDLTDLEIKQAYPYLGEIMMGHLRYGTFGNNSITSVHPFCVKTIGCIEIWCWLEILT